VKSNHNQNKVAKMKTKTISIAKAALTVAVALSTHRTFAQNPAATEPEYLPGELLIKFVPRAPDTAILDTGRGVGASELERFADLGVRHWRLGQGVGVEQALKILAAPGLQRWIEYAEPNYLYHVVEALFPQVTADFSPPIPCRRWEVLLSRFFSRLLL
jgi:hypothetical protein